MGFGKWKHHVSHHAHNVTHAFHGATRSIEDNIHDASKSLAHTASSVGHAVTGKHHHRGREIVQLAPAFQDVRVQAISGLEAPKIAERVNQVYAASVYLKEVADDIYEQLTLRNNDIRALVRDASIFNGCQAQRLAWLEGLIGDIQSIEDNEAEVWKYMNQLLLAQRRSELG